MSRRVGIVGHEGGKFNNKTYFKADGIIRELLISNVKRSQFNTELKPILVSGACHLGGIDTLAEHIADEEGNKKIIHRPKSLDWKNGYRLRNLKIAKDSEVVYVIVVTEYPQNYKGMRFDWCYHCDTDTHIKSGGCWTANQAIKMGRKAMWIEIAPDGIIRMKTH